MNKKLSSLTEIIDQYKTFFFDLTGVLVNNIYNIPSIL